MSVKWNNCFLCLNQLTVFESNVKRIRKRANLKFVQVALEYLLRQRAGKYSTLPRNILKLFNKKDGKGGEKKDGGPRLGACEKCLKRGEKIVQLQLQLEAVQMKLIHEVNELRTTILKRSKAHGDQGMGVELFEEWISEQEQKGVTLEAEKRFLGILHDFQNAVFENNVIQAPCVFLKTCLQLGKLPVISSAPTQEKLEMVEHSDETASDSLANDNVKVESAALDSEPERDEDPSLEEDDDDRLSFSSMDHSESRLESNNVPEVALTALKEEVSPSESRQSTKQRLVNISKPNKRPSESEGLSLAKKKLRKRLVPCPEVFLKVEPPLKRRVKKERAKPTKKTLPKRPKAKMSCETCPWQGKDVNKLEFHLRFHENPADKRFKCEICRNCEFSGKQYYSIHMDSHQGKYRIYCDICGVLVNLVEMRDHIQSCHSDAELLSCENCSYCTSVVDKYLDHLRKHDKSAKFTCFICSEDNDTRLKLVTHLYQVHAAVSLINCPFPGCDKSFLDKMALIDHKNWHRTGFRCAHCEKSFKSGSGLKVHIKSDHLGIKDFACDQCDLSYKDKTELNRHRIKVHGAEKIQCPRCPNLYTDHSTLRKHMRIHEGTTFPCDQCGKSFTCMDNLNRHSFVHVKERDFACETCGKLFQSRTNLASHRKAMHSPEKKYKCQYCDKAFTMFRYLKDHLRTHTGERPFVCESCGASFTQAGPLNNHKKKHLIDLIKQKPSC